MTINIIKFWHYLLKTYYIRKEIIKDFSLLEIISHILTINDMWKGYILDIKQL